jgi:hypothetical protein
LRALNLSHLRVELRLSEPGWGESLARASDEANALGAALEAALFISGEAENELRQLRKELDRLGPRIAAWLVLPAAERATTPPGLVGLARLHLEGYDPATPFGGGTARHFTELNRERPPIEELDLVCYSFNPQVHTFDDASMMESIEGQAWTVRSAQQFANGLSLAVTPITLKPRSRRPVAPGELPSSADPRQTSPFCAAWTLGSLSALARAGVQSVTYYETTGCLGVMESEQGSSLHEAFPSQAGSVFPVYHVFASLGEFALGEVVPVESTDALRAVGLAVCKGARRRMLLANLTDGSQQVIVRGLRGRFPVRRLGESNAGMTLDAGEAAPTLSLSPYDVVEIDGAD